MSSESAAPDGGQKAAMVTDADDDWQRLWDELGHAPLPCQRCGCDLRDEGSRDVLLGCGACDATVCASCGRIWAAMGPASVEHSAHGLLGHLTLSEQPRYPAAVKRHG